MPRIKLPVVNREPRTAHLPPLGTKKKSTLDFFFYYSHILPWRINSHFSSSLFIATFPSVRTATDSQKSRVPYRVSMMHLGQVTMIPPPWRNDDCCPVCHLPSSPHLSHSEAQASPTQRHSHPDDPDRHRNAHPAIHQLQGWVTVVMLGWQAALHTTRVAC